MNRFTPLFLLFLILFLVPTTKTEAQVRRTRTVVVTSNKAYSRKVRRQTRRQVRRVHRKNRFRTLAVLPSGTRAVAFRNINYYPVRGVYYVRRNGIYMRSVPPFGFRLVRLTSRMIRLSVLGVPYVYSEGLFYQEVDGAFQIVPAPKGATIEELPEDVEEIILDDITAYELYDILYAKSEGGYQVIGTLEDFEE